MLFRKKKPIVRTITTVNYLKNTEHGDEFFKYYKEDLFENDEYDRTAKELKEDYDHEKVYRYDPLTLPFKMEGLDVYSKMDEWVKVGRLKKNADLDGELSLEFYPNIYMYVGNEVEKDSGEHYFGVTVERTVSSAD